MHDHALRFDRCFAHGGGKRCTVEGCERGARGSSGRCIRHGTSRKGDSGKPEKTLDAAAAAADAMATCVPCVVDKKAQAAATGGVSNEAGAGKDKDSGTTTAPKTAPKPTLKPKKEKQAASVAADANGSAVAASAVVPAATPAAAAGADSKQSVAGQMVPLPPPPQQQQPKAEAAAQPEVRSSSSSLPLKKRKRQGGAGDAATLDAQGVSVGEPAVKQLKGGTVVTF